MNRKWFPIAAVILFLFLATLACGFSASTASITSAVLTKDKDNVVSTTVFGPDDVIYCVVKLANAPDDTKVKAVWTVVQAKGVDSSQQIAEKEITTGLDSITFNLAPSTSFQTGKYKVDLYLNDKLNKTQDFEVQ
jgi:hypothetical protein